MDNMHDFINLILLVGLAWLMIEMIRDSMESRIARKQKSKSVEPSENAQSEHA